jgi:hypothetical protein
MNLEKRIIELEQITMQERPYAALVYSSRDETEAEALERFQKTHGRPFPENGTIVRIDAVDASKEGGGRVLPGKGEPGYEPDD